MQHPVMHPSGQGSEGPTARPRTKSTSRLGESAGTGAKRERAITCLSSLACQLEAESYRETQNPKRSAASYIIHHRYVVCCAPPRAGQPGFCTAPHGRPASPPRHRHIIPVRVVAETTDRKEGRRRRRGGMANRGFLRCRGFGDGKVDFRTRQPFRLRPATASAAYWPKSVLAGHRRRSKHIHHLGVAATGLNWANGSGLLRPRRTRSVAYFIRLPSVTGKRSQQYPVAPGAGKHQTGAKDCSDSSQHGL